MQRILKYIPDCTRLHFKKITGYTSNLTVDEDNLNELPKLSVLKLTDCNTQVLLHLTKSAIKDLTIDNYVEETSLSAFYIINFLKSQPHLEKLLLEGQIGKQIFANDVSECTQLKLKELTMKTEFGHAAVEAPALTNFKKFLRSNHELRSLSLNTGIDAEMMKIVLYELPNLTELELTRGQQQLFLDPMNVEFFVIKNLKIVKLLLAGNNNQDLLEKLLSFLPNLNEIHFRSFKLSFDLIVLLAEYKKLQKLILDDTVIENYLMLHSVRQVEFKNVLDKTQILNFIKCNKQVERVICEADNALRDSLKRFDFFAYAERTDYPQQLTFVKTKLFLFGN